MKRILVVSLFFIIFISEAQDSSHIVDSLIQAANTAKNDTVRMTAYHNLTQYYIEVNWDSSLIYCNANIALTRQLNLKLHEALALSKRAYIFMHKYNYGQALEDFLLALAIAKDPKSESDTLDKELHYDPASQRLAILANIYHDLGHLYGETGFHEKQIQAYFETKKIATQLNDENALAFVNMNLGSVYYFQLKNLDSALIFSEKALAFFKKSSYRKYEGNVLITMGKIFSDRGNEILSKRILQEAIDICKRENNIKILGTAYFEFAKLFAKTGENDSSLRYCYAALEIANEQKNNLLKSIFINCFPAFITRWEIKIRRLSSPLLHQTFPKAFTWRQRIK